MSKGQKRKARGRPAGSAGAKANRAAAGAAESEPPFMPNPPRRNAPLLVTSVVVLASWLAILLWLAVKA